jgi:hypothetical protein
MRFYRGKTGASRSRDLQHWQLDRLGAVRQIGPFRRLKAMSVTGWGISDQSQNLAWDHCHIGGCLPRTGWRRHSLAVRSRKPCHYGGDVGTHIRFSVSGWLRASVPAEERRAWAAKTPQISMCRLSGRCMSRMSTAVKLCDRDSTNNAFAQPLQDHFLFRESARSWNSQPCVAATLLGLQVDLVRADRLTAVKMARLRMWSIWATLKNRKIK